MSTLPRTLRNLWKVGIKDYVHQIANIGDTKAGILVGTDRFGNKFFENIEELPLRTRWVDYKNSEYNPDQIEPGWHAWMSYMVDSPPAQDPLVKAGAREWEPKEHKPVMTLGRGAYRPYSTTKSKITSWQPVARERSG